MILALVPLVCALVCALTGAYYAREERNRNRAWNVAVDNITHNR